jgi:signal transduction histidine kinase
MAEIEEQIWDSYRIAELLGIAVDSSYTLRDPIDFDLCQSVRKVLSHYKSEAAERHIRFQFDYPQHPIRAFGEKAAIEQAIGQLVSNAVKYGFGGTDVLGSVSEKDNELIVRVADRGHSLPVSPELEQIWDFGFRGKGAKERHVNGSGIGLYSVRKIVTGHQGRVYAKSSNGFAEFFVHLPSANTLKKRLGLLL